MLVLGAEAGVCARRCSNFLSSRRKKVTKERATLQSASLRFAAGNLRCSRPAGSRSNSLHCVALKQSRALIRWPLRSSAHPEGNPGSDIPTGHCFARPRRRSAGRLRPHNGAERSNGPCGCSAVGCSAAHPLLAAPAAGRLWGGMGVEAPMLRELTRRGCPSGAAQQQSEFHGAPRNRPAAGLPRSAAKGPQTGGRLSFAYFSLAKQRKVSRLPGRQPGLRPQHKHTVSQAPPPRKPIE